MSQRSARGDRSKMEVEAERLEQELATLEREWTRVHHYGWIGVLALPAGIVWGPFAAGLALLTTMLLVATAAYLLYVRRKEARGDLEMLHEDMAEIDR